MWGTEQHGMASSLRVTQRVNEIVSVHLVFDPDAI